MDNLSSLRKLYTEVASEIQERLTEFRGVWERGSEAEITAELVFCLLTPQSKAKRCWKAVESLLRSGLSGDRKPGEIEKHLSGVRFKRKKARHIARNLEKFQGASLREKLQGFKTAREAREWLVKNVEGFGLKEASHFLRNIGFSDELAILDRHVLKGLKELGVIAEAPPNLSKSKYLEVENEMMKFSRRAGIPMGALDLLLWYSKTGEVFK